MVFLPVNLSLNPIQPSILATLVSKVLTPPIRAI